MTPLRKYRKTMGWNVPQLSRKIEAGSSMVWKIEQGVRGITPALADKLQILSGVPAMAWMMPEKYHNPYSEEVASVPSLVA
ncbi:MAG: helix-turn-helix domain-containing protein [Proteobacteria bacterium]|nr:helix-turn-helix transcriptional regulator [Desulfobulbaceae bacterium]MBU4152155.1 helix-turn-helix domain-containing protein [Pseudomonadota bacterium]